MFLFIYGFFPVEYESVLSSCFQGPGSYPSPTSGSVLVVTVTPVHLYCMPHGPCNTFQFNWDWMCWQVELMKVTFTVNQIRRDSFLKSVVVLCAAFGPEFHYNENSKHQLHYSLNSSSVDIFNQYASFNFLPVWSISVNLPPNEPFMWRSLRKYLNVWQNVSHTSE